MHMNFVIGTYICITALFYLIWWLFL